MENVENLRKVETAMAVFEGHHEQGLLGTKCSFQLQTMFKQALKMNVY